MKDVKISIRDLSVAFGNRKAISNVSMDIRSGRITTIIGPSGCGKTTILRVINRMNDLIEKSVTTGTVKIDDIDIYGEDFDVINLRTHVGMVFQESNLFPKSIFENLVFGPRLRGTTNKEKLLEIAETSSKKAFLWDEIKDRLDTPAMNLSVGEQQRLCIARALAVEPEILLMDEPASALDPVSTAKIEDLIYNLKKQYTILLVTHNMQQAGRIGDYTAFFFQGKLIEYDKTTTIFTNPMNRQTEQYLTGRFG